MKKIERKPILIVIAGPNGSGKTTRYSKSIANCSAIAHTVDRLYVYDNSAENKKLKPLFRLTNGVLGKMYVKQVPEWARNILPETNEKIQIRDTEVSD